MQIKIIYSICMPFIISHTLVLRPVLVRRSSYALLEKTGEMLRILKSHFISYFADRTAGVEHLILRHVNQHLLYMFLSRFACFLFNQVAQVICGKM